MHRFITKQEGRLYRALKTMVRSSVNKEGNPKRIEPQQLRKAIKALSRYEEYDLKAKQKISENESR